MLNAIDMLCDLADGCTRMEDAGFWILTSAAWRLTGGEDNEPSSVATYFPAWAAEQRKAAK